MGELYSGDNQLSDRDVVCGQTTAHLVPVEGHVFLHHQVLQPFRDLAALALDQGIELAVASGYRSFDRQLLIWNAKASGQRPVFDSQGEPLDLQRLSDRDKVFAILRWSALPGASRHHWGTDMDIWDRSAVGEEYRLQLVPDEYAPGGPFARLGAWLDGPAFSSSGFYRPYFKCIGNQNSEGVAPEPWHLSYKPLAQRFERCLSPEMLAGVLANSDIALGATVLENLDEIFARFVCRVG